MTSVSEDIQALIEELRSRAEGRIKRGNTSLAETLNRAADALSALSSYAETEVTTMEQIEALPDNAVIRDSMGDLGVIGGAFVHYAETQPIRRTKVAKHYLPASVVYLPEVTK